MAWQPLKMEITNLKKKAEKILARVTRNFSFNTIAFFFLKLHRFMGFLYILINYSSLFLHKLDLLDDKHLNSW